MIPTVPDYPPQSYSLMIRDAFYERVKALPFYRNFRRFSKTKQLQVQPQDIPYCGVYFVRENLNSDGDPNHGPPKFEHVLVVGFSVIIKNNNPVQTEQVLDAAYWVIMNDVLRDPTLYRNNQFIIESILRGNRTHHYGSDTLDNETPMAELQFELQCNYRNDYPPYVTDRLVLLHLEAYPDGIDPAVLTIVRNYFLWPEEGLTLGPLGFAKPPLVAS